MSAESLRDVYADELKDLWSANDQMSKVVTIMADKATDENLRSALTKSIVSIDKHSESIRGLLEESDGDADMEHCKGMEGLVKEATKHVTKEAPESGSLLDLVIIAQYQRMSHYGLAGFGTAGAYAKALGMDDHSDRIEKIVTDIHKGDNYASKLAAHAEEVASSESELKGDAAPPDSEEGEEPRGNTRGAQEVGSNSNSNSKSQSKSKSRSKPKQTAKS